MEESIEKVCSVLPTAVDKLALSIYLTVIRLQLYQKFCSKFLFKNLRRICLVKICTVSYAVLLIKIHNIQNTDVEL